MYHGAYHCVFVKSISARFIRRGLRSNKTCQIPTHVCTCTNSGTSDLVTPVWFFWQYDGLQTIYIFICMQVLIGKKVQTYDCVR